MYMLLKPLLTFSCRHNPIAIIIDYVMDNVHYTSALLSTHHEQIIHCNCSVGSLLIRCPMYNLLHAFNCSTRTISHTPCAPQYAGIAVHYRSGGCSVTAPDGTRAEPSTGSERRVVCARSCKCNRSCRGDSRCVLAITTY